MKRPKLDAALLPLASRTPKPVQEADCAVQDRPVKAPLITDAGCWCDRCGLHLKHRSTLEKHYKTEFKPLTDYLKDLYSSKVSLSAIWRFAHPR